MELWVWLTGYLFLFALLHGLLYYVYRRSEPEEGNAALSGTPAMQPNKALEGHGDQLPDEHEITGETTDCPNCGATNAADPTYTYCWYCLRPLRTGPP